jgi:hypothetical protein
MPLRKKIIRIAIGALLFVSAFLVHGEDSNIDPLAKLPKPVAEAWKKAYPKAKVLTVVAHGGGTRVNASDELNAEFTAEFDPNGELLQQSARTIMLADIPTAIQNAQKRLPGYEWDPEHVLSSKAPDGKLLYNCRVKANGKSLFIVWTEDGLISQMGQILSPEEQKAAEVAKANELPAITVKVTLNQNGRIVHDGKTITDDEYKKLLDDQPKDKSLIIDLHFSTAIA